MNRYPKDVFGKSVSKVPKDILSAFSSDEIKYMIAFLKRYNEYRSKNVFLEVPDLNDSRLTERDVAIIERIDSQPDFRISLKGGGRMGPCQQSYHSLSQSGRQACRINDNPINEIDLQGAGLQFIDIMTGGKIFNSPQEGYDPYTALTQNAKVDIPRIKVKQAFKMLFDPRNKDDSSQVREALGQDNIAPQDADIFTEYLYDVIEKSMTELSTQAGLSINFLIYRQESIFLHALLEKVMQLGFHCLPLNDSYLFPQGERRGMQQLIKNTSEEVFQRVLSFR